MISFFKKIFQLSLVFILFWSCKAQKSTSIDKNSIENGLIPKLIIDEDAFTTYNILERLAYYNVPGISISIFENNQLSFSESYGYKNSRTKEPVTNNTKFQIASLGKAVTAIGIFKLAKLHDLDINADINSILKHWKIDYSKFDGEEKVTISNLLNHTSGIKSFGGYLGIQPTDEKYSTIDVLEGKNDFVKIELDRIPGSRFSYSSGAFTVAQYIIEEVSGKSFENFIQKEVFVPLKMINTTFNQYPKGDVSLAHKFDGKPNPNKWLLHPDQAAGGLWSTSQDLCKFLIAINKSYAGEKNSIISQERAREMLKTGDGWGLGVGLRGTGENVMFFHGGSNPGGFCALMFSGYQRGIGIAILNNGEGGNPIRDEIAGAFYKHFDFNFTPPKVYQTIKVEKEKLQKYIGTYHWKERGSYYFNVTIDNKNNIVLTDEKDRAVYNFIPITDNRFLDIKEETIIKFNLDPNTKNVSSIDYDGRYTFFKTE